MSCFRDAVEQTPGISLQSGLQGMGADSSKVTAANTRKILGSVPIDSDLVHCFPNEPRWDYVVGYRRRNNEHLYFVEVHPAQTTNAQEVLQKARWLRTWLGDVPLGDLSSRSLHWIATGRVRIPKNTPQYRQLARSGILGPVRNLRLQ
jgi:hypothetical protein